MSDLEFLTVFRFVVFTSFSIVIMIYLFKTLIFLVDTFNGWRDKRYERMRNKMFKGCE